MPHFSSLVRVALALLTLLVLGGIAIHPTSAGDAEFSGSLDGILVPNTSELDQITFRPFRDLSKIKFATTPEMTARITAGLLYDPVRAKSAILALLVEQVGHLPFVYVDIDSDNLMADTETFPLARVEGRSSTLQTTIQLPFKNALFQSFPIVLQYYQDAEWNELKSGETILLQSKEALANGKVDIEGKPMLVQYGFNPQSKKISVNNGWLGVDGDGDGEIDLDHFSPEAAEARDESVIFRAGNRYFSTRRVDLEKNQILMRKHAAGDYQRVELTVGSELPEFSFSDFEGKKRKLSEFRGKYVLIDFWAMWCGACRRELPYQKAAYSRFRARGFEILGMNNDTDYQPLKAVLKKSGINWPQATLDSIDELQERYRIHSFPTTLLIGPDAKIISLGRTRKKQLGLRGPDLLATLDELLPP